MDSITEAKKEFRTKQWTKIIQSCKASGMTTAAWCAQQDINLKSYYYWLRKLRSKACQTEIVPVKSVEQPIIPLAQTTGNLSRTTAVTVYLPAASVAIPDGASRETIEAVLATLKALC